MESIMLLTTFFKSSFGSIGVLKGIGVVLFLGTEEVISIVDVGSRPEGSKTVGMAYKVGDSLGGAVPSAVGARTEEDLGVNDVLFF